MLDMNLNCYNQPILTTFSTLLFLVHQMNLARKIAIIIPARCVKIVDNLMVASALGQWLMIIVMRHIDPLFALITERV